MIGMFADIENPIGIEKHAIALHSRQSNRHRRDFGQANVILNRAIVVCSTAQCQKFEPHVSLSSRLDASREGEAGMQFHSPSVRSVSPLGQWKSFCLMVWAKLEPAKANRLGSKLL
jgi:hypothetical protein